MLTALKNLIRNEPVRVAGVVAAIVVAVAQQLNIVLDPQDVGQYVVQGLVILGLAETARAKVSPVR